MTKYETMLVTSAKLDEEAAAAVVGKFKALIEANGTIDAVDEWGKRRLAYPINKEEEGVYTLIHFTSEPDFPAELERVYRITDGVLRSLIIAKPEGEELPAPKQAAKAEEPAAEQAEAEAEAPAAEEPVVEAAEAEAPAAEQAKAEEPAAVQDEEPASEEEAKE